MANIVPFTDKQLMIANFLEIVVGQTVETAHQFLQATNWRIEDAMQLFYMENEGHVGTSSSYVAPVQRPVIVGDHNLSVLEEDIRPVYATKSVVHEPCPDILVRRDPLLHAPTQLLTKNELAYA